MQGPTPWQHGPVRPCCENLHERGTPSLLDWRPRQDGIDKLCTNAHTQRRDEPAGFPKVRTLPAPARQQLHDTASSWAASRKLTLGDATAGASWNSSEAKQKICSTQIVKLLLRAQSSAAVACQDVRAHTPTATAGHPDTSPRLPAGVLFSTALGGNQNQGCASLLQGFAAEAGTLLRCRRLHPRRL